MIENVIEEAKKGINTHSSNIDRSWVRGRELGKAFLKRGLF